VFAVDGPLATIVRAVSQLDFGNAVLGHEQKYIPKERKCSSIPQTPMKWGFRGGSWFVLQPCIRMENVGKPAHHK
jgi:hypothetical protein